MAHPTALEQVLAEGRLAWPAVELERERLASALPWLAASAPVRFPADVYLAAAALLGGRVALALFDDRFIARIPQFIHKVVADPDLAADVQQSLREKLLWSPSGPGRLAAYRGEGPLSAWVCVVAVRAAIRIARGEDRFEQAGAELGLDAGPDPHDDAVKRRARSTFNDALGRALAHRTAEERRMLRRYYVEGATLAEIAAEVQVNVSTVWRRLQALRREVLAGVREEVTGALNLAPAEFESLSGLVQSQLDVRLSALMSVAPKGSK